jgi:hypothetical protein
MPRAVRPGHHGRLEVWRWSRTSADMQLDIERGALFAIRETTTLSLRLVPWHPWWRTDDVEANAVLYRAVQALGGRSRSGQCLENGRHPLFPE